MYGSLILSCGHRLHDENDKLSRSLINFWQETFPTPSRQPVHHHDFLNSLPSIPFSTSRLLLNNNYNLLITFNLSRRPHYNH